MSQDKQQNKEEYQLPKDKVDRKTIHLENEEIERMPDSDDDYRLPRELPAGEVPETDPVDKEVNNDDLIDGNINVSPEEIVLLKESEQDNSSDETWASDILEDTDEDGERLNEGPDEDNVFDTGDDLDIPDDVLNPDIDAEDDKG